MTWDDGSVTEISLDGVALRQHNEPYLFDYPPYAHQLRLEELIRGNEGFVAVNDSPTGGGKTSSWLAPVLAEKLDTIAIYPTNALVIDQVAQVEREINAVDHDVSVLTVTSERLADKRSEFSAQSNGEVIERWYRAERKAGNQVILLMNPDIFVLMARDMYRNPSREYGHVSLVVVDEFHRAGRKEQNTLRYLLDELYERDESRFRLNKIAFLSATPDAEQERRFDHAMAAPYKRVTEDGSDEQRPFTQKPGDGWRSVMPPVELEVRTASTFGTADELLANNTEDFLSFCQGMDGSSDVERVAIILDGIHEVKRVSDQLESKLDRRIERIDGFYSENKREKLRNFEVLVSNSAVEVGIDFDIDRLLFAGHDRASFVQRLGRLRGKEKQCKARCYVPRQVARQFTTHERVVESESLTREELDDVLDTVYPEPRRPASFGWRYSAPEALEHLDDRLKNTTPDLMENVAHAGQRRVKRHFLDGTDITLTHDDLRRTKEAIDWRVLRNLQWYRGDSIQALVYDRTKDAVRTYDMFYLLRYGDIQFYPEHEFERLVPEEYADTISRLKRYVDGFCTYDGTIQTTEEGWGRSVSFMGPRLSGWLNSQPIDRNRKPRVLEGIKLRVDRSDETQSRVRTLDHVNQRLQSRRDRLGEEAGILCYPVSMVPTAVKERYNLGEFFFLYTVAIQGQQASLALGTDALYLHCHVMEEAGSSSDGSDDDGGLIGL